jgi:hypothetical protein
MGYDNGTRRGSGEELGQSSLIGDFRDIRASTLALFEAFDVII